MSKLEIKIDDVILVVQTLGITIQKKLLSPEEFRRVQPSWERLSDTIAQLQRRNNLEQLYPSEPVQQVQQQQVQPVPVVSSTNSAAGTTQPAVGTAKLPMASNVTEGTQEENTVIEIKQLDDESEMNAVDKQTANLSV